jgi:hypothetical protein
MATLGDFFPKIYFVRVATHFFGLPSGEDLPGKKMLDGTSGFFKL